MRIAVLGGGNGSFAAAGDFALAGHETRLWRRDGRAVAAHRAVGGKVLVKDFEGQREADRRAGDGRYRRGGAWCGADRLCPAPATAQADIAAAFAPPFADGQVVFLPPGTFGSDAAGQGRA